MRYLLMIYSDESYYGTLDEKGMGELMGAYGAFQSDVEGAGVHESSDRLQPTSSATTVRIRKGDALVTDGPFAETKEQLGGYYLIDVPNLDEAIAWAKKIPTAEYGSIEIRPIWEMEG